MIFFCVFSQAFFVVAASLMLRVRLQDYNVAGLERNPSRLLFVCY